MNFNVDVNNVVRSVVIGAVLLPFTCSAAGLFSTAGVAVTERSARESEQSVEKRVGDEVMEMTYRPCLDYYFSKVDSTLERTSKTAIDEAFGGDVDHKEVCKYVLGITGNVGGKPIY